MSCLLLFGVGGFLLSHNLPVAVPSALAGLASGFGMGTGRFPAAIGHRQTHEALFVPGCWCCVRYCVVDASNSDVIFVLVFVCSPIPWLGLVCLFWSISTSSLHTLRCFQVWPINPIVCRGPQMKPHLKTGFPLRCFQRLSLPYVANQRCSWRNNWHTRGTSVPVLSY